MKQYLTSTIIRLSFGALFLLPQLTSRAQSACTNNVQAAAPVTIQCLGAKDDMIVFHVAYPNAEGNKFSLIIKDQDGNTVYQHSYQETNFLQRFQVPQADKSKVTFLIRQKGKTDFSKTFEINVNSHIQQEVAVKKVY